MKVFEFFRTNPRSYDKLCKKLSLVALNSYFF